MWKQIVPFLLGLLLGYFLKDYFNPDPRRTEERPAFTASITSTTTLDSEEIVKFDRVWLNIGQHYNSFTGVFTVPKKGLYLISNTVMSDQRQNLHCHLWKNNEPNVGSFGTDYSAGALNAVMALAKGDKIYVRHDKRNAESIYGGHWSMFSGYLIAE